jgi:hypothetical protein
VAHLVVVEQPEFVIEPAPTPPLPAETLSVTGPHQITPHLLLHPVCDKAKASTGGADGKVVHPATYNRVDELDDPTHRLGVEAPETVLELVQQCGALLELGRIIRRHLPCRLRMQRNSKPKNPKPSPFTRSTALYWVLASAGGCCAQVIGEIGNLCISGRTASTPRQRLCSKARHACPSSRIK